MTKKVRFDDLDQNIGNSPTVTDDFVVCLTKVHRMKSFFVLLTICFLGLSCSNQFDTIPIPGIVILDIDEDGITDFEVRYSQPTTKGDPVGNYKVIDMKLIAVGNNQVLRKERERPLFLNEIETINQVVKLPLYWASMKETSKSLLSLASIRTGYDEVTWRKEWSAFSSLDKASYLIGIKLTNGTDHKIGYIEFSINKQTGEFTLLEPVIL